MKAISIVTAAFCLLLTGCEATRYTTFAPFDARLEPIPGGGAQYLVLVNRGEIDIHNFSGSVYIWLYRDPNVTRLDTRAGSIYGHELKAGESLRFHYPTLKGEASILVPVSKVELVGHCEEGYFRQAWVITESGQLRNILTKPAAKSD